VSSGRQGAQQRVLLAWLGLGLAAYALLPWYFPQNLTLLRSLGGVFGGSETASGLVQALQHGKPWLWGGLAGLLLAALAGRMKPGRGQGWALVAAAGLGLAALVGSGFAIGATGWSFEFLLAWFGELPQGQFGMGLGAAMALNGISMNLSRVVGPVVAGAILASVGSGSRASFYQRISDEGNWLGMMSFWLADAYSRVVNGEMTVEESLAAAQESVDSFRDCVIAKEAYQDPEAMRQCLSELGANAPGAIAGPRP
jgi:hypothetical protein